MKTLSALLVLLYALTACQPMETDQAQQIVDQAIESHGGDEFEQAHFRFRFRDREYVWQRDGRKFEYKRIFTDSLGHTITDILNNKGFTRLVEGKPEELPEERVRAYTNSVNSVIYFAVLPYRLNDEAVQKEYLGETEIRGVAYHKVKVSFRQEGGGEDFEDEFIFWFHRDRYTMDYLAYSYHTESGGMRFREAYNPRIIGGILWQDYINYKPSTTGASLERLEELYEQGALEELSRIELENIEEIEE
jgi:hypothetical protein